MRKNLLYLLVGASYLAFGCGMLESSKPPPERPENVETYNISYSIANESDEHPPIDPKVYNYGQLAEILPLIEEHPYGYEFLYWQGNYNGVQQQFSPGDFVIIKGDLNLRASYKTSNLRVYYYDGDTDEYIIPPLVNDRRRVTLSTETLIQENYIFAGWNTEADGSGTQYYAGETIEPLATDLHLFAQWIPVDQNVLTIVNEGSSVVSLPFDISGRYDCQINWGDGTSTHIDTSDNINSLSYYLRDSSTHRYNVSDTYTITVVGAYEGFKQSSFSFFPAGSDGLFIQGEKIYLDEIKILANFIVGDHPSFYTDSGSVIYGIPDLSETNSFYGSFCYAEGLYPQIDQWDTSVVKDFRMAFVYSTFNQSINHWDISNADSLLFTFAYAGRFDQDLDLWDTSSVTSLRGTFKRAYDFNGDISTWDTSSVRTMEQTFHDAKVFNRDISEWDTSSVTNMNAMFLGAHVFNQDISDWDVSSVEYMSSMFSEAFDFNQDLSLWDTSKVKSMSYMFGYNYSSYLPDGAYTHFNGNITSWDTSSVTNMSNMFRNAVLFNQDLSAWNTSSVTTLDRTFCGAEVFNGNISAWNTSSVTDMSGMFCKANAFNQNISGWNVSQVESMYEMFCGTRSFNQNISGWDVSSVKDMGGMFYDAWAFNQDISSWDVSQVEHMRGMFYSAILFDQDLSSWDISQVSTMDYMFNYSGLSTENYSAILIGWEAQNVQPGVELGAMGVQYNSTAQAARQRLIDDHGWIINDGGLAP